MTRNDAPSSLDAFLSARGRAARMPEGVRVWGERAARAGGLDATMGVVTVPSTLLGAAGEGDTIAYIPEVRDAFTGWSPAEVFPYAPVAGIPAFRETWRRWIVDKAARDESGPTPSRDRLTLPVATAGVTGGLAAIALLTLDPGDEVLIGEPRWDGYDTTFAAVAGALPRPVPLLDGERLDVDRWEAALERQAGRGERVVWVANFPHNPTGYVPTADEADRLASAAAAVAERTGCPMIAICDDAYEGYVYADRPRASLFHRLIDLHPRLLPVKVDGITKELLFWGGRLGAVTAALPPGADGTLWDQKLSAVVRGTISSASTAVQALAARVLEHPEAFVASRKPVFDSLARRHGLMLEALDAPEARRSFRADPFHGGLFALLHLVRGDSVETAKALLARRIGVVPFRDPERSLNALRITYATLPEGRIGDVVKTAADLAGR